MLFSIINCLPLVVMTMIFCIFAPQKAASLPHLIIYINEEKYFQHIQEHHRILHAQCSVCQHHAAHLVYGADGRASAFRHGKQRSAHHRLHHDGHRNSHGHKSNEHKALTRLRPTQIPIFYYVRKHELHIIKQTTNIFLNFKYCGCCAKVILLQLKNSNATIAKNDYKKPIAI